jgi:hypothetical protein
MGNNIELAHHRLVHARFGTNAIGEMMERIAGQESIPMGALMSVM